MTGTGTSHENQRQSHSTGYALLQEALRPYQLPQVIMHDEMRSPTDQLLCQVLEHLALASRRLDDCQKELNRLLADVDAAVRNAATLLAQRQGNGDGTLRDIMMAAGLRPAVPSTGEHPAPVDRSIDVRCLGHFAIYEQGRQIALPHNRKAEAILKYLFMHHASPVSRDVLLRLGWPDAAPSAALNDLNTTISILRTCLNKLQNGMSAGSPILYEMGHYLLNPEFGWRIDIVDFDACYERGLLYERHGCQEEAMRAYQEAIGLYHGDLLAGDLADDWMTIERERLRGIFLTLLIKLGNQALAAGEPEEAMCHAYRLLKHQPCREDAHRLLICCFSRLQQRTQALRQYDICRDLLQRELNIEPAPETVALRSRIERGDTL